MGTYRVTTDQGVFNVTTEDPKTDWKQVVGTAAKDVFRRPMAGAKDLLTNPETMAKALPPLAGMAGAISPIPGGATMGTVGGRQISNEALRLLGKRDQIPSGLAQAGEAGLSVLGDVGALPAIKSKIFGGQIGKAEQLAGMANIEKEAPPSGARTAVKFIQGLKNKMNTQPMSTQEARSIKPAIDMIFKKGWLEGTEYGADLAEISKRVNSVVNQIPGRAAAAEGMAKAMTIPRNINKAYKMIPPSVRKGIGYGTGVGLAGGTAVELIRKLFGD